MHITDTKFVHTLCFIILSVSSLCWFIQMWKAQCRGVQSSAWRSHFSFKWGPEGTESWTEGHIQREFPHIMGSNTRCRENRGCLLCWLTLHPLTPCRIDIDCVWSDPASSCLKQGKQHKKKKVYFWNIYPTMEMCHYVKLVTTFVFSVFNMTSLWNKNNLFSLIIYLYKLYFFKNWLSS